MNKENNIPQVTYVSSSSVYDYQSDQDKKFPAEHLSIFNSLVSMIKKKFFFIFTIFKFKKKDQISL